MAVGPGHPRYRPPTLRLTRSEFLDRMNKLKELAGRATTEAEARMMLSRIAQLSRIYRIQSGIGLPLTPLEQAQQLDKNYVSRPHLEYISNKITEAVYQVESGYTQRLAISTPPRAGKSTLASQFNPLWILRRHPEWKIMMLSYSQGLVTEWARNIRQVIETHPTLGIALRPDAGAGGNWRTVEGGGIYTAGVGGEVIGRGAKVLIIDDPISDFVAAHSKAKRDKLWNTWLMDIRGRMEEPFLIQVVMCMTGDTPVLRPDGTETSLRDIRPGDFVATYEGGELTSSRVLYFASQGFDRILKVRTRGGREVRANARHPFLVVENGVETWRKAEELRPGMLLRAVASTDAPIESSPEDSAGSTTHDSRMTTRASVLTIEEKPARQTDATSLSSLSESASITPLSAADENARSGKDKSTSAVENGQDFPAPRMVATTPPSPKDSARLTTTRSAGRAGCAHLQTIPRPVETPRSSTATESLGTSTTEWSLSAAVSATSAERSQANSAPPSTGLGSSASTTTTEPESSGDCCATTATCCSRSTSPQNVYEQRPTTWSAIEDEIESVTDTGLFEEVFDVQIERTENFIANGLVSHNTRYHEDDFIGRILSPDYEGDPRDWENIVIPAIADSPDDPLGRTIGQPLYRPFVDESEQEALAKWQRIKVEVGTYVWEGTYQQHPSPAKGTIFDIGWWRYWTTNPSRDPEDGKVLYLDNPEKLWANGRWLDSWDAAFKGEEVSDYVVGQRWVRVGEDRFLTAQVRGQWGFTDTLQKMKDWRVRDNQILSPYGQYVHQRLIEDKANGPALIDSLKKHISGIKPVPVKDSKPARARAVSPEVESGHVYLPHPDDPGNEWVKELLSELRAFPSSGVHDDQCDALTQALHELRDEGYASTTVPGSSQYSQQTARNVAQVGIVRNIAEAAKSDLGRSRTGPPRRIIR